MEGSLAKFVLSQMKTELLQDDHKFTYRRKQVKGTKIHWICSQEKAKKCYARATTEVKDGVQRIVSILVSFFYIFLLTVFYLRS